MTTPTYTKIISAAYHIAAVTRNNDIFESTQKLSETQFVKITGETKNSWQEYVDQLSLLERKGMAKQFSVKLAYENKRINSYYFSNNDNCKNY